MGLLFLAVPLGIVFCVVSKLLAHGSAIDLWLYTNYWSPTILENAPYRHDFLRYVGIALLNYGMLAGAAWIGGFALGFVCRRSLPLNAVVFGVLLFFAEILYSPRSPVWMVLALVGSPAVLPGSRFRPQEPSSLRAVGPRPQLLFRERLCL